MATLTVGSGKQYSTLSAAVAASHDGDTIDVQAGTYTNDFAEITHRTVIEGVGGMANFIATNSPPNGKAILTMDTDATINNLSFSGAKVPDGNGAGIRYQGGNLTINNSYFHDNQDGLLGNAVSGGSISINNSEFAHNGAGDGQTHGLYVGDIASLSINTSYFHDTAVGHEIKSRAESNTIKNSRIQEQNGTSSYQIDLPNGGKTLIDSNTIQKAANSGNPAMISFGEEGGVYSNSSLEISNNRLLNDFTAHSPTAVVNKTGITAQITNNSVYGLTSSQIASGPANVSGTVYLSSEPSLYTGHPWS